MENHGFLYMFATHITNQLNIQEFKSEKVESEFSMFQKIPCLVEMEICGEAGTDPYPVL